MFWHSLVSHKNNQCLNHTDKSQAGFGLIELLVSISIMVIVSAVILVNHGSFNNAVLLRSQAYQIAMDIREVQLSAVSAAYSGTGFREVHGVYFDKTTSGVYKIFLDSDDDYFYDSSEEYGMQGGLDSRFEIKDIQNSAGTTLGANASVAIIFERPNFDAEFYTAANTPLISTSNGVKILIGRVGVGCDVTPCRIIEVTRTGQISVMQ